MREETRRRKRRLDVESRTHTPHVSVVITEQVGWGLEEDIHDEIPKTRAPYPSNTGRLQKQLERIVSAEGAKYFSPSLVEVHLMGISQLYYFNLCVVEVSSSLDWL